MKICPVSWDTVCIPVLIMPPPLASDWLDMPTDVEFRKRYVHLKPRVIDGRWCMAEYDRETDTLFIRYV